MNWKIENGSCRSDQLIAFAPDFHAGCNVVLLLVSLGERSELRARQNGSGAGMRPGNAALQNERMFEVVCTSDLSAVV